MITIDTSLIYILIVVISFTRNPFRLKPEWLRIEREVSPYQFNNRSHASRHFVPGAADIVPSRAYAGNVCWE